VETYGGPGWGGVGSQSINAGLCCLGWSYYLESNKAEKGWEWFFFTGGRGDAEPESLTPLLIRNNGSMGREKLG